MALETRYAARPDWPVERLVAGLSALLTVRRRPIARQRITFLDTADGRLGRAGACLTITADAGGNRVQWRQGHQRVGCIVGDAVRFAWDLPPGAVRQRLEPIVAMRRLLPLAEAEQDGMLLEVINETGKTIARLNIVAGRARLPERRSPWQPFRPFLALNALRGYDDQCAGPIAILASRPGIEHSEFELQGHVLHALGASAPQDVSVYRAALDPTMPTDVGTLQMQRELWRIVTANHAGALTGLDSEFLHDLRGGLRRSRTLLEQLKGALPQGTSDRFAAEFEWLGRVTGPARDLDVLLLWLRSSAKQVENDHLQVLLERLTQARAGMQAELAEQLSSERYLRFSAQWQMLLSQDASIHRGDACGALPLVTAVSQRVWWLYRRTLSGIEHVDGNTPVQELHRIRGHAKALRYVIDAAAGLYEPGELEPVLRALTRLQSALGELNDACVAASWLRQYSVTLNQTERDLILVHQAFAALVALAERRAAALRKPANQQLLRFGESATRTAFERVFPIKHLTELVS